MIDWWEITGKNIRAKKSNTGRWILVRDALVDIDKLENRIFLLTKEKESLQRESNRLSGIISSILRDLQWTNQESVELNGITREEMNLHIVKVIKKRCREVS